jgi:hypothetical protein
MWKSDVNMYNLAFQVKQNLGYLFSNVVTSQTKRYVTAIIMPSVQQSHKNQNCKIELSILIVHYTISFGITKLAIVRLYFISS